MKELAVDSWQLAVGARSKVVGARSKVELLDCRTAVPAVCGESDCRSAVSAVYVCGVAKLTGSESHATKRISDLRFEI